MTARGPKIDDGRNRIRTFEATSRNRISKPGMTRCFRIFMSELLTSRVRMALQSSAG